MANIREYKGKRTRSFHVQVRVAGYPPRTATFPTRRMAERWAKVTEAEMIEGRHFRTSEAKRRTLAQAIDRYVERALPKLRNGDMHRTVLPYWREQLGHLKLADITADLLTEHRDKLSKDTFRRAKPDAPRSELKPGEKPREYQRKPNTVNNYLRVLSKVFTVARKEWRWITTNPLQDVSKLPTGKGRVRFLTEDERLRLLTETAKDPQLHTLVVLALSTASRAGELLKLTWHDVELAQGRATLRDTKNDEERNVWLHGEALKLLKEHQARGLDPVRVFVSEKGTRYQYSDPFTNACQRAGIEAFRFHDLRHSAATYLARLGATEQQLKAIGGWKSGVVSRYVHLAAQDAKAVLERMNNQILGSDKPPAAEEA